jgi:regulation of enolase protein 1 (concanavalin A-like superfamily)
MKARLIPVAFAAIIATALAQEPLEKPAATPDKAQPSAVAAGTIEGWGKITNPDEDCQFSASDGRLKIEVPGSGHPHDMSAELLTTNAPRVLQPVKGDFVLEVTVDGQFAPGADSTQPGRSGYTGAGLLVYSDAGNYVRLERATLHWPGEEPRPYTNFEIRIDGRVIRIGSTGDAPPPKTDAPILYRLERRGNLLHGSVSQDRETWTDLPPKGLPESWGDELQVGVAAISTSKASFEPTYTELKLSERKRDEPAEK